ncbi:MAG TPA: hypothetical protein VJ436_02600 [Anaerolineales bacterium]|nr:hypothetical protein [Anaerolineales bacterium]
MSEQLVYFADDQTEVRACAALQEWCKLLGQATTGFVEAPGLAVILRVVGELDPFKLVDAPVQDQAVFGSR